MVVTLQVWEKRFNKPMKLSNYLHRFTWILIISNRILSDDLFCCF